MQTHLTPANPESLFFAGIGQAQLHPCSPKCSAVLKAINSWQLFFPFLSEVIRQHSVTEGCVFKAAWSLSMPCRYHIILQSVGWSCRCSSGWGVSCFTTVVVVSATLAKQWSDEEESCNDSWRILGRGVTWSRLVSLVVCICTKRISWTIKIKIFLVGAWN